MAELILVCWRDIPAQVIVKVGRRSAKRVLGDRFQEAIDRAAMRAGLRDTDAYLGEWRRTVAPAASDDLETEADAAAARLDVDYPPERLRALVANGGLEPVTEGSPA
jgi:Virulence factor